MKYLKLYSNCLIVTGYSRDLIVDLQFDEFYFINKKITSFLLECEKKEYSFVFNSYFKKYGKVFKEYIQFLSNNKLVFFCKKSELKLFSNLELNYSSFSTISNAIIDLKFDSIENFNHIISQLEELNCQHIEVRIFSKSTLDIIDNLFYKLKNRNIRSVTIYLPYIDSFSIKSFFTLSQNISKIQNIIIYSSNFDKIIPADSSGMGNIIFTSQSILSNDHCGFISMHTFTSNLQLFTESQKYNTCLNRKISIDVDGNIKNCPSMKKSYGNISSTTLREVLEMEGFKDLWYIHKDQIEICKDCEFRHICTDCRAYIQDPNNKYSKPAKCSYNPYTATWGDENPTNNPLYGQ